MKYRKESSFGQNLLINMIKSLFPNAEMRYNIKLSTIFPEEKYSARGLEYDVS
jgi:hypothetical protein